MEPEQPKEMLRNKDNRLLREKTKKISWKEVVNVGQTFCSGLGQKPQHHETMRCLKVLIRSE